MDDYRILLDEPAERPALRFDEYARAFAGIIRQSGPRFAVGIFGDWGSGKTTLMRAIQHSLEDDQTVVTLWFNAWRYEREPHLIVPLLDTLREELVAWAERAGQDRDLRDRGELTVPIHGGWLLDLQVSGPAGLHRAQVAVEEFFEVFHRLAMSAINKRRRKRSQARQAN